MVRCRWSFESFLSDYEQGAYNAVLYVFPEIVEEGCFFHLCKRLDFQVKRLGLMPKYQTFDDFKLRVKMLAALTFVSITKLNKNKLSSGASQGISSLDCVLVSIKCKSLGRAR